MNKNNYLIMRINMFISSYFPLYLILLFLNLDKINRKCKLLKLIKFSNIKESLFILILLMLIMISLKTIWDLKKTRGSETYTFKNINNPDDSIISYMMTYIIPLLSSDFLSKDTLIINITLFLLIGFMYLQLNLLYLNPLWLLFGYYTYKTESDKIAISNIKYSDIKSLEGEPLRGCLLGGKIYLIQKKDNDI